MLDGAHLDGTFRAFLHAPFGDDSTGERNKTSLGMQVTLWDGDASGRAMLLGDLDYPPLRRIFVEYSADEDKAWDVLLAPHHCSKSAKYFKEEGDDEEVLKRDVLKGATSGFLCTGEYPDEDSDEPIVFAVDADGVSLFSGEPPTAESKAAAAVTAARGGPEPHGSTVGFGAC